MLFDSGKAKYAVYAQCGMWLQDSCAGGSWSHSVEDACWFDSADEARSALKSAEIAETILVIRVR